MNKTGGLAPIIVSIIVLLGFATFSFLAMKPELAGVKDSVVLFLLGSWSTLAAAVVTYWVGSSNSSAKKDEQNAEKDKLIAGIATGTGTGGPIIPPSGKT